MIFEMDYVDEKFSNAVFILAVGSDRIQERLIDARREFAPITEESIPPTLTDEFLALQRLLPGTPGDEADPTVPDAIREMDDGTAVELARAIYNLSTSVESWVRDMSG